MAINLGQIFFISPPEHHIYSDMHGYIAKAIKIAENQPLTEFDFFFPIGLSYFYAAFFILFTQKKAFLIIGICQCLLLAIANALYFSTLRQLFDNKFIAWASTLTVILYPPLFTHLSFFVAEPLCIFLIISSFYLALKINKNTLSPPSCLFCGAIIGFAILTKGQAAAIIPGIFALFFTLKHSDKLRKIACIATGIAIVIVSQFIITSLTLDKLSLYVSSNDSYNMYLGQSRREAVGCLDLNTNHFYVFHNNNAGINEHFLDPVVLPVSILNRDYFRDRTIELWKTNPSLQLTRSFQNVVELFSSNLSWPARNIDTTLSINQNAKLILMYFCLFGFLCLMPLLAQNPKNMMPAVPLILPIGGICLIAFMYMGQPRYLIPFLYFLIALGFLGLQFAISMFKSKNSKTIIFYLAKVVAAFVVLEIGLKEFTSHFEMLHPIAHNVRQEHYLLEGQSIKLWQETGKAGSDKKIQTPGYSIELQNFQTGEQWQRDVSWSVRTQDSATVIIQFPPQHANAVSLFLTDGDSKWRGVRVISGKQELIISELHAGKWVTLDLTTNELINGKKEIQLSRITGKDVALSAVVIK